MGWRSRMARLTGQGGPAALGVQNHHDNNDKNDKNAGVGNFVNIVNFSSRSHKAKLDPGDTTPPRQPGQIREPVPLLTPSQCREIGRWSVPLQQEFVRHLEVQEAQGWPLGQAEALAYHHTLYSLGQGLVDQQAQPEPLPPLPAHLETEAQSMAARLEAAGWRDAYELAQAIPA